MYIRQIFLIQMKYPSAKHVRCTIIWEGEPRQLYLPSIPYSLVFLHKNVKPKAGQLCVPFMLIVIYPSPVNDKCDIYYFLHNPQKYL